MSTMEQGIPLDGPVPLGGDLAVFYRDQLLDNVLPFWQQHSLDRDHGGYFTLLDRAGAVYGDTKFVWLQAREVWLFAHLYNTVERRMEWLEDARLGAGFLMQNVFDQNGRSYFALDRQGRPAMKPRRIFSDVFVAMGLAEYARAADDPKAMKLAEQAYGNVVRHAGDRDVMFARLADNQTAPEMLAGPMVLLCTAQAMAAARGDAVDEAVVRDAIDRILERHWDPDRALLMEFAWPDGTRPDDPDGRLVNPGHAIETAWFLMEQGKAWKDTTLIQRAVRIVERSLEVGWDKEHGGILYFVDRDGWPSLQLEWDMKLWWVHTETMYALLLAESLTGESKWRDWYEKAHRWSFARFPDPVHGEWYGYLHRDGSVASECKGSRWKGAFHLPRTLLLCWRLLQGQGQTTLTKT